MTTKREILESEIVEVEKLLNHDLINVRLFAKEEILRLQNELRQLDLSENPNIINLLLTLTPEHGRTSCSDEDAINSGRCNRCTLLNMKKIGVWNRNYDYEINLKKV